MKLLLPLSAILFTAISTASSSSASEYVSTGDRYLSLGEFQQAINSYDQAVKEDPTNYLYLFKRGAAYMSVGRETNALEDFNNVLLLRPGFESALLQRSRINLKLGRYDASILDANQLPGEKSHDLIEKVNICRQGEKEAVEANQKSDLEGCITHSSQVLAHSPSNLQMRRLRAKCRLSNGDAREALVDLSHMETLTRKPDIFVTMANIYYYKFHEYDNALQHLRKCLQYDSECRACKDVHKNIRNTEKKIREFNTESRQKKASGHQLWSDIETTLVKDGLLDKLKTESIDILKNQLGMTSDDGSDLVNNLIEALCDSCYNLNRNEQGVPYCDSVLQYNDQYIPAILLKAQVEIDKEQYDNAVNILVDAIQNRQLRDSKLQNKLRETQVLAKRAKSKDYYKILGVDRSATEKEIKKGYRQKTKEYHPDKYRGDLTAEQVERKMAEINEAYEILGDAEMRRKYDNGEIGEDGNVMNNGFHGYPHGFQQGYPGGGFAQQFGGFQFSQGGSSPFGQQFFMKQDRR